MKNFLQFIPSVIGSGIIGSPLHNSILGTGIWLITYAIMPYYPRGE